jgi:hypothetical protein
LSFFKSLLLCVENVCIPVKVGLPIEKQAEVVVHFDYIDGIVDYHCPVEYEKDT